MSSMPYSWALHAKGAGSYTLVKQQDDQKHDIGGGRDGTIGLSQSTSKKANYTANNACTRQGAGNGKDAANVEHLRIILGASGECQHKNPQAPYNSGPKKHPGCLAEFRPVHSIYNDG
jgi:hypothetical protein